MGEIFVKKVVKQTSKIIWLNLYLYFIKSKEVDGGRLILFVTIKSAKSGWPIYECKKMALTASGEYCWSDINRYYLGTIRVSIFRVICLNITSILWTLNFETPFADELVFFYLFFWSGWMTTEIFFLFCKKLSLGKVWELFEFEIWKNSLVR